MLDQQARAAHAADLLVEAGALLDELIDAVRQRQARVDRDQRRHDALVLLARDGLEQRLAIGEVLEDRALRHARARRDLRGGRPRLALVEQAEQRVHERLPGALGPDRAAVALLGLWRPSGTILNENPQRAGSKSKAP